MDKKNLEKKYETQFAREPMKKLAFQHAKMRNREIDKLVSATLPSKNFMCDYSNYFDICEKAYFQRKLKRAIMNENVRQLVKSSQVRVFTSHDAAENSIKINSPKIKV